MKRIKLLLVAVIIAIGATASAQQVTPISINDLPAQAKEFVDAHFKGTKVVQVEKEALVGILKSYKVIFENGVKVEFTKKGDWKEIESRTGKLPNSVVPEKIRKHITSEFPKAVILEIEKKNKGYDVEISNGLTLQFALNGDFKRFAN